MRTKISEEIVDKAIQRYNEFEMCGADREPMRAALEAVWPEPTISFKWRALAGAEAYSYVSTKYRIWYYDHQQHHFGVIRSKDGKWWS